MGETMNYIFKRLQNTENALDNVYRVMRTQTKINKNTTLFAIAVVANLIIGEIEREKQEARIRKLEKEIEELKYSEGESKCND